jgi:bifunctional DNA-binding transcriptional regulator/antitoxin component of YhaV-PrlF toxin-antitoxin module
MNYSITITSQGQMSIPVSVMKQVGLTKPGKAILEVRDQGVYIKPQKDILSLRGALKTNKRFTKQEEQEAAAEAIAEQFT